MYNHKSFRKKREKKSADVGPGKEFIDLRSKMKFVKEKIDK